MNRELRPYQADALQALRDSVRQGVRRIMLQAATGSGKTLLAAAIAEGAYRKGKPVAFVVPRIDLIEQTLEEFGKEGITDVGVMQADHLMTDAGKPIQICSIQTVSRRSFPQASVVLFDEGHELHKGHLLWMADPAFARVPFIGLSATPWTRGLGQYFESLLVMATTADLIAQGYLSDFRVFAVSHPDLHGVKITGGEYQTDQLSHAMQADTQTGGLTADIVRTWQDRWGQDKTLVFAVDRPHAAALQQRFQEAGITCGYQDHKTPMAERRKLKQQFHSGEVRVICNVDTLTLGVDWDVRCLSLCRPTRSEIRYVQIVGRALRRAEGKQDAMILDHSDTTARLGFVTDIHHDHLNCGTGDMEGERVRHKPLPKDCPECTYMMSAGMRVCPNCGFERKAKQSGYHEADGELTEYTRDHQPIKLTKKREYSMAEKVEWYCQLLGAVEMRGGKRGWADHTYKAKFGCWPDWRVKQQATPVIPGATVRSYIRSRAIAYRAKMEREGARA